MNISRKLRSLIDQNVWLDQNEPEVFVNGKSKMNPKIARRERKILKALTGYRIDYLAKDIRKAHGRNEVVAYRPRVEPVYASGYTTPNFTGSGVWIVGCAKRGESIPAMSICVPKRGKGNHPHPTIERSMKPNGHRANKPFTARSLVGMTMGARKRAWLSNALYPVVFPSGIVTDETEMQAGYSWPEIRDDWPLLGERLRPCHGCTACNNTMSCCGCRHGYEPWDNRYAHHICDPEGPCDGSGVLPARKAKR